MYLFQYSHTAFYVFKSLRKIVLYIHYKVIEFVQVWRLKAHRSLIYSAHETLFYAQICTQIWETERLHHSTGRTSKKGDYQNITYM